MGQRVASIGHRPTSGGSSRWLIASPKEAAGIDGVEEVAELGDASGVGSFGDHGFENGFEEAAVFGEGGAVAGSEGGFDSVLRGGSDELDAADKNARELRGRGTNGKRQDRIHEGARNNVNEARTFFEPGVFPGFEHGVGFVGKETLSDEHAFEVALWGSCGAGERRQKRDCSILQWAEDAVAGLLAAALEENEVGDFGSSETLDLHGAVRRKFCRNRNGK